MLDDRARAAAPGRFARLIDGATHYETAGPPAGPAVVLVHGFSTPLLIWERTAPALAAAGYCTVAYDLYGRGYSDRLKCAYGPELYERQLHDLLAALGVRWPVDLVGFSMGAQICARFADRHPARVRRLVLIDPAGFDRVRDRGRAGSRSSPASASCSSGARGPARWPTGPCACSRTRQPCRRTSGPGCSPRPGFGVRDGRCSRPADRCRRKCRSSMRGLEALRKPVLIVWGTEDRITPYKQHDPGPRADPVGGVPGGGRGRARRDVRAAERRESGDRRVLAPGVARGSGA